MIRRKISAPGTAVLLAVILGVFLLEFITDFDFIGNFAIIPEAVKAGQVWRLVTGTFLHAGALHVLVNTVALFQLGRLYEWMFGTKRFLLIYFATGIAGSGASTLINSGASVGASGAVFGILGAFIFSIRNSPRWRHDRMGKSIVSQSLFWIVANIVITWSVPQIDKAGHIGGLIAGLLLGALLPHRVPPPPPAEVVIDLTPYEGSGEDPAARRNDH